jgi:group I intron endonuclease
MLIEELKQIDENDRFSGIYALYNIETTKVYVGSSKDIYDRVYGDHYRTLINNSHYNKYLQSAFNKDKDSFIFVLLEVVENQNRLIEKEQFWMDSFKSYYPENGYNLAPTAGSMLGFRHSDKTKEKISNFQKGRNHSEETKKKRSESLKGEKCFWYGKTLSQEHIHKIQNSRGEFKQTEEGRKKISEALKTRVRKKESYDKIADKLSITILQYSKNGDFIKEWKSIAEAAKSLNISRGNIGSVLHGKRNSSGGFKWKFKSEVEVGK